MTLEKVLRNIVVCGIFALPFVVLIVVNNMFFPYVVGKNVAFRVIIEIIFSTWIVLAFLDAKYRPRWTFLLIAITAFVGITALSDLLGENFFKSFWSNYERMEGLITLLHILAYVVVAQSVMIGQRIWLLFWRVSITLSALISIHVLLQSLSSDAVRLYSTLGNPIYLAVYSLFHFFIALVLFFREGAGKWERYLYLATIPFLLYGIYLTSTRGATLGIVVGLLLTVGGIAFSYRKKKAVFVTSLVSLLLLITAVSGFWLLRDTSFVREDPLLNRFASMSLDDPSIFARTLVWNMAITGIKEKPLLGWGQENFNYVFNFNYDPEMYNFEPWYDRTHNIIFDWAIASGLLGLLAYLSIFLALLLLIYKTENFNISQKWILLGLLGAYGFQNLTVFDQVISYILFFSVVAWIAAVTDDVWKRKEVVLNKEMETLPVWLILVVVPISFVLVFSINVRAVQANLLILAGLQDAAWADAIASSGDVDGANFKAMESVLKLVDAADMKTYGTQEANEQLAHTSKQFASKQWVSDDVRSAWYAAAVTGMNFEKNRSSMDARFPVFLADVHSVYGQVQKEKEELNLALILSPQKQTILLKLANNSLRQKKDEEALAFSKEAYELAEGNVLAELFYAITLIETGDIEGFEDLYSGAPNLGGDNRVLLVLLKNEEFTLTERIWEEYFLTQNDPSSAFVLAVAYRDAGYVDKAIVSVKRAVQLDGRLKKEGDQLINFLNN